VRASVWHSTNWSSVEAESKPNEHCEAINDTTEDDGTEERTKSTYIYILNGGKCAMLQLNVCLWRYTHAEQILAHFTTQQALQSLW
jgi:hypothetical protein